MSMESAPSHFLQSDVWIICFIYTKGGYSFGGEQRGRPAVEEGGKPRGLHNEPVRVFGKYSPLARELDFSLESGRGSTTARKTRVLVVNHLGLAERKAHWQVQLIRSFTVALFSIYSCQGGQGHLCWHATIVWKPSCFPSVPDKDE